MLQIITDILRGFIGIPLLLGTVVAVMYFVFPMTPYRGDSDRMMTAMFGGLALWVLIAVVLFSIEARKL